MHVDVDVPIEPLVEPEFRSPRARVRQRRLAGLAHHVAELAGEQQLTLARQDLDLDGEQFATHLGPRQPVGHADPRLALDFRVHEARRPQKLLDVLVGDGDGALELALRLAARHLAADLRQLAFEAAHSGLARVLVDQRAQRGLLDLHVGVAESGGLDLLGHQEAARDLHLVGFQVARQPDDLHAIHQRSRNRVETIRGAQEHDLRQVEIDLEVMVVEGVVLFGIEHLEQRRRGIAAIVGAQLVDFIEQEHGVLAAGAAQALDDAARHRADVSAAMTADLGFITNSAQ